jgi:hypothetical protein
MGRETNTTAMHDLRFFFTLISDGRSSQLSMYSCHTNPYKWTSVYTSSCSEYNDKEKNPAPARN